MIFTLITVLIFLVCALLVLIVLVQNSKGGGLASNFQSSGQVMGVRKTNDFLEKATWYLAGALLILSIAASAAIPREKQTNNSRIEEQIQNVQDPNVEPSFPVANDNNAEQPAEGTEETK